MYLFCSSPALSNFTTVNGIFQNSANQGCIKPVSYTHLDVYKRQLLFFPLTTIILPFTNFWLPMLPALLCIYPPLNKCFTCLLYTSRMRFCLIFKATPHNSSLTA